MTARRRGALVLAVIGLALLAWPGEQQAQGPAPAPRRGPAQRLVAGRPDSALVWGPVQYTSANDPGWTYSATTLEVPGFDAGKRYFVRITNGDTVSGANRVSQASLVIAGKEFLSSSDLTSSVSALNKVIWLTSATSTLQFGVRGPNGSFVRARIYETEDPSYTLHSTWGDITVPNGLNLIGDNFSKPANASGPWTVRVVNGDVDGSNACTNLKVTLNGVDVVPLGLVNATNRVVLRQVTLQTNNTITLRLYGTSGYATLYWAATDTTPPTVTLVRPVEAYVTDSASVATTATLSDQTPPLSVKVHTLPAFNSSAGFTVAAPLPVDGLYDFVVQGTDRAGYSTTITRHVVRDTQAPVLDVGWPPVSPLVTTDSSITVTGAWSDTSITTVTVDDVTVGADSSGSFSLVVPLDWGSNGILFRARDAGGRVTEFKRYVNRAASESALPATVDASSVNTQEATAFRDDIQFLFDPNDPEALQYGPSLERDSIKADRAAVIRGLAFSRDLGPLANVKVRVLDHPEFGETRTREDGRFDIAVNGGQALTIRLTKPGYLEAQRQVAPAPLRFHQLDDVAMLGESSRLLPVDVTSDTMLVGRFENDANGDRRIWVYVPTGAVATITPEGGDPPLVLSSYRVRLKEFTVGANGDEAMPGPLPPSTAYTYCVDMSLREADSLRDIQGADAMRPPVTFSESLSTYVREFLGLPVGTTVPSGYYDPRTGRWVAGEDGCVLKVVGVQAGEAVVETDGVAGPDSPGRLDSLGIDIAERRRMAEVFATGDVLWRMRVDHFTAHDFNLNQGSAPGSQAMSVGAATSGASLLGDPCLQGGCVIEIENRVLGEEIPVLGTPYALHYRSSRQQGDRTLRWLRIPLTGSTVPPELRGIRVVVDVAGRRYTHEVPTAQISSDLVWRFEDWDGQDVYGRPVVGATVATVQVGYEWPARYAASSSRGGTFGNPAATAGAGTLGTLGNRDLGRIEWRTQSVSIGAPSLEAAGLGQWTISPHHVYDSNGTGTLYRGDGTTVFGAARSPIIKRFGGNGVPSSTNGTLLVGQPALSVPMSPADVAVGADGSVYYADAPLIGGRVVRITPQGIIELVAGTVNAVGSQPVDGESAVGRSFGAINSIAVTPSGELLIACSELWRVYRVTKSGLVFTVAGNGSQVNPPFVEGAVATTQRLVEPTGVAMGPDGSIFIADRGANRIYRVATDGTIRTFAGNGTTDYSVNPPGGGPATTMTLANLGDVAVDPRGRVYCSDPSTTTSAVFEIAADGYLRKLVPGPDHNPKGLAIGPDGALYVGQTAAYSGVLRREPTGEFVVVAGTIVNNSEVGPDFAADDGSTAAGTRMAVLQGLAVAPDGDIYCAESGILGPNGGSTPCGIRRITRPGPAASATELLYPSPAGTEVDVFSLTGRHLRTVDARTGLTRHSFVYGPDGQLASITDAVLPPTTIERVNGVPSAIIGPFGQRTELGVTGSGYLETVRNPAGDTDSLGYSGTGVGLLAHHRSAEGEVHSFEYDADGRLTLESDPAGGHNQLTVVPGSVTSTSRTIERNTAMNRVTSYNVQELLSGIRRRWTRFPDLSTSYRTDSVIVQSAQAGGEIQRQIDRTGAITVTRTVRDKRYGMLSAVPTSIATVLPSGKLRPLEMTRTWGAAGVIEETYSIAGDVYRSSYDSLARRLTLTSPMNRIAQIDFDAFGRPTTLTRPGVSTTYLAYDPSKTLLSDITQGERTWHYTYDAGGRLQTARDPLLREVTNGYDAAGRLLTQDLPGGRSVAHTYDRNGGLTSLVPPGRPAHGFHYTPVGLNDRYTPPAIAGITDPATYYAFNLDRQLTRVTRPDGGIVDLAYDATSGALASITHPRGVTSYTYWTSSQSGVSAVGQLKSVTSADTVTLEYTYDGPLVKSETWSGPVAGSVAHEYDIAFRDSVELVTVGPVTDSVGFSYDRDGLLVRAGPMAIHRRVTDGSVDSSTVGLITHSVGYDNHGDPVELHYSSNGTALFHQHLERDDLARVVRSDETWWGVTTSRRYEYDTVGRLARVLDGTGAQLRRYEYDGGAPGNGNRTAERGASDELLASASYDAQDRLLGYGAVSYGYTAAGELTLRAGPDDTLSTVYDALGNLVTAGLQPAATSGPSSPVTVGTVIAYQVDGLDRRVRRIVNDEPVQGWLYRNDLNPVAELDGSGVLQHRYVYATRGHVPDLLMHADTAYRMVTDHLGSVRAVVRAADGVIVQRFDYDAWGVPTLELGAGFQSLGYAGGITDPDTKLVRFGARDYEPAVGRWTSKDPIGLSGGQENLLAYCASDPLNFTDPSGLLLAGLIPAGESFADSAAWWYAQQLADPSLPGWARPPLWVGGSLAALWTTCNSDKTAATLSAAYAARVLGPFPPTKDLPVWLRRLRGKLRVDPPHHGKGWHWDGDIPRWFRGLK